MQRSHAHGFAILNSGAVHILGFWVRVIPIPPGQQSSILGIQWALNLRSACKNEIMRMISIFWKIPKSGAAPVHAQ